MFKRDLRASKRVCLILTPAIFQSVCLHLSIYKTLAIRFSSFIFGPYIFQIKEYNNQNTIPLTVSCSYNPYDFASCHKAILPQKLRQEKWDTTLHQAQPQGSGCYHCQTEQIFFEEKCSIIDAASLWCCGGESRPCCRKADKIYWKHQKKIVFLQGDLQYIFARF